MVRPLELWDGYTREEVHDIFDPDSAFTPQTGKWGISGIVRIPGRESDFIFFVTFGKTQAGHQFDESITEDGVLTWQSQPQQRLDSPMVRKFVEHDERISSIHLFLRPNAQSSYTYFGQLGYLTHDVEREAPVYFQWQLLDWPAPAGVLASLGIQPEQSTESTHSQRGVEQPGLTRVDPPQITRRGGIGTRTFQGRKQATRADHDARNSALGLEGELLVMEHEKQRLLSAGRKDLADKVVHVAVVEGDSAGYDVKSFEINGDERYLEVKTTRGPATSAFFVSPNQVDVSARHPEEFVLMRLFAYSPESGSARFFALPGSLADNLRLEPSEYRALLK